jgi:hypothetical protein
MDEREKDALVAEKVLGFPVVWRYGGWVGDVFFTVPTPDDWRTEGRAVEFQPVWKSAESTPGFKYGDLYDYAPVASYGTDYAAAMHLVETWPDRVWNIHYSPEFRHWQVEVWKHAQDVATPAWVVPPSVVAYGALLPLAIRDAALRAVGVTIA